MRTTVWDYAVIGLTGVIVATAYAVRESSAAALPFGAMWGVILGTLFCTFVRLVTTPMEREMSALRDRVADLERRSGAPGAER
jgi:hypothetical protein